MGRFLPSSPNNFCEFYEFFSLLLAPRRSASVPFRCLMCARPLLPATEVFASQRAFPHCTSTQAKTNAKMPPLWAG